MKSKKKQISYKLQDIVTDKQKIETLTIQLRECRKKNRLLKEKWYTKFKRNFLKIVDYYYKK